MGIQCDCMASCLQAAAQCNEWLYIPARTNGNNTDIQVYCLFSDEYLFIYGYLGTHRRQQFGVLCSIGLCALLIC
jgi:primosomal replication protein N